MNKLTTNKARVSLTAGVAALAVAFVVGLPSQASALPVGWSCVGTCGTLGPNGVVTAAPGFPTYEYVSTNGAPSNNGLNVGSETNGSVLTTSAFTANGTDVLEFYFNYVTSDGSGFADYAWAQLVPTAGPAITLFTARTTPTGNTVPGFGLPGLGAGVTLAPPSTPIIPGAPAWSPLGGSSGLCFTGPANGCGYTGWIKMLVAPTAGNYTLQFGTVNWNDTGFDSGMAIAGAAIGGVVIGADAVPEPASLILLGSGLATVFLVRRSRARRQL